MLCLCDLHTKKCVFFSTISPAIRFCTCLPRESRFSLPHTQSFAAARKIACRIRTYGITMEFHFCQTKHNNINAYRFRLPRRVTLYLNCLLYRPTWVKITLDRRYIRDINYLLPKVHVLSGFCNYYSKLFSELWVKTYLDRAVTYYPGGRVKRNTW